MKPIDISECDLIHIFADIEWEPFILTEYGQGCSMGNRRKGPWGSPVTEIGHLGAIANLLADSDMISFLPDLVTRERGEAGTLCYSDVVDADIDIRKQLIYHKNKWMSKNLRAFIEYIRSHEFST